MASCFRRALIASLALLLLLATGLVVLPAREAKAALQCTSLVVLGLRGSGEPYESQMLGMGSTVYEVYKSIKLTVPDVTGIGIPYQAIAIDSKTSNAINVMHGPYFTSVEYGGYLLEAYVKEALKCPGQQILLIGYSQGAQVVMDHLSWWDAKPEVRSRISGVVVMGDPTFTPNQPYNLGTYSHNLSGFTASGPRTLLDEWTPKIHSYCNRYDAVCNYNKLNLAMLGSSRSGHYKYVSNGTAKLAGAWAGNRYIATRPVPVAAAPAPAPAVKPASPVAPPPIVLASATGQTYRVYHTGGIGLKVRSAPSTSGAYMRTIPEGAPVTIVCQVHGQRVVAETDMWDQVAGGGWVYDEYVSTPVIGNFSPPLKQC